MIRLTSILLAVFLWPGVPAHGQNLVRFDQARLQELRGELDVLQIAYGALLAVEGRGSEGELSGAQRGRADRVHRAIRLRTMALNHPARTTEAARRRLESDPADLVRLLWRAVGTLNRAGSSSEDVRLLAEHWTERFAESPPEAEPEATHPLPDLDELAVRVWTLRLARRAHAARGDERSLRTLDSALRYADLRLEDARWAEQATAMTMVAPPEHLARVVERAAEHFDAEGEARRARICRRLVRFYRGEPQVEEPPLEDNRRPLTEEQERHLRVALAAREAHLLAGETAGAARLDRLARTFSTDGTTDLTPAQITTLLSRAAELHRAHGHPRHAESAETVIAELNGTSGPFEALRARVERLEQELQDLRRKKR